MDVNILEQMLSYKRPANSKTEQEWVDRFILSLLEERNRNTLYEDSYGNIYYWINMPDGSPSTTCFTAHTDTVHREEGIQLIELTQHNIKACDTCLGADDGTGVAILLHLIEKNIPALYCFFRAEEIGGIGSDYAVKNEINMFDGIQRMISFDRRGRKDVITHQGGSKCASQEFAKELSRQLGGEYSPSNGGVFTDSANFTDIIPECTNISVGYTSEHTDKEKQSIDHFNYLLEVLPKVDWENLPTERKAGDHGYFYEDYSYYYKEEESEREFRDVGEYLYWYEPEVYDFYLEQLREQERYEWK